MLALWASAAGWLTKSKWGPWLLLALGILTLGWFYKQKLIRRGRDERIEEERIEREEARERMEEVPEPSSRGTAERLRDGSF